MLTFRNLEVDAAAPVEQWPYEAIVTAIERGTVVDWVRITAAIARDPWGEVARQVEEYLSYEQPYGVAGLLHRAIDRARAEAQQDERTRVAAAVRALVAASSLSREEFARRIGTSRSRLSTYCTGSVIPSAALLQRMSDLVDRISSAD